MFVRFQYRRPAVDVDPHSGCSLQFGGRLSGAVPLQRAQPHTVRAFRHQRRPLRVQDGARGPVDRPRVHVVYQRDPPRGGAAVVQRDGGVSRGRRARPGVRAHGGAHRLR